MQVVIYHKNCADGICSAWVFYHHALESKQPAPTFLPMNHHDPLPNLDVFQNKQVILVDICLPRPKLEDIRQVASHVTVLDHHKSAIEDLRGFPNQVLDMNRSGAQIAWDEVYPNLTIPRPWFVDYIADRDLWTWKLPHAKAITKALHKEGHCTFEGLEKIYQETMQRGIEQVMAHMVESGQRYIQEEEVLIKQAMQSSVLTHFQLGEHVYRVHVTHCDYSILSEVGNRLAKQDDCDFAVIWNYDLKNDLWKLSFRGVPEKRHDLSSIARQFTNGGGHPNAAGATLSAKQWSLHQVFAPIDE